MKRKHGGGRALPKDWTEVIDKVQEVLAQAQSEATAREQGMVQNAALLPAPEKAAIWKKGLDQFEEHLRLFQAGIQQAQEDAADAELALADGEKALEHWLACANEITRRVVSIQPVGASSHDPAD